MSGVFAQRKHFCNSNVCCKRLVMQEQKWHPANMKYLFRQHRKRLGLTIDQAAEISGLSRGFISQLENGQRQPSGETVTTLAQTYKVNPIEMVDAGDLTGDLMQIYFIMKDLSADDRRALIRSGLGLLNVPSAKDHEEVPVDPS